MGLRKLACLFILAVSAASARHELSICGTERGNWRQERFLHRQSLRNRALRTARLGIRAAAPSAIRQDAGNIALVEDADGVVARRNQFDLDRRSLVFWTPDAGATYHYLTTYDSYDYGAADGGTPITGLGDDDSRLVQLPFDFPFYGQTYHELYINSDGNLTFTAPDTAATDRSLGRATAGPPRIAGLFDDLDPTASPGGVRVLAQPDIFIVSWPQVPEWSDTGYGARQNFQVRLYPDGRIDIAWSGVTASAAVVGIAPGHLAGSSSLVSFSNDTADEFTGAVMERFGNSLEVDITTAAQQFYRSHEDAYDYLVIFNNMDIPAASTAVAYETTVRSNGAGYGDEAVDVAAEYGSPSRLRAVMNLGPLSQYPDNPAAVVPLRQPAGDTPVTIIAHETGHLFLAYGSVRDPLDPFARPMLGFQNAHWYFGFNSDASLLEGNRLQDNGPTAMYRFTTVGTVEHYSALDQYLMGFRGADEVETDQPLFYAEGAPASYARRMPQKGVNFNGSRKDVHMGEILHVLGRRTPDYTVAQRRFRFAFIMVVPQGQDVSTADLAKLESFRTAFEQFYTQAASGRATADASLKRNLRLSVFPAAGVLAGGSTQATLTVDTPPAAPLTVSFETRTGSAGVPASVTIPAGETSAAFLVTGIRAGVEELSAVPSDDRYMTATARVQVSAADAGTVRIAAVSGNGQVSTGAQPLPDPVVVRVTDANQLPYPGLKLLAAPSEGGTVEPAEAMADVNGQASFRWTPGEAPANHLQISIDGAPGITLTIDAGARVVTARNVFNLASLTPNLAPGTLAGISGVNLAAGASAGAATPLPLELAGVRVLLDGQAVPVAAVADGQVGFLIPNEHVEGMAQVQVENALGISPPVPVLIGPVAPAIFVDETSGLGKVVNAATGAGTWETPAQAGDLVAISCTGLGPVVQDASGVILTTLRPQVFVGSNFAAVVSSGLAPGYQGGMYVVVARVPAGLTPGRQTVSLSVSGIAGNEVAIVLQ